MSDNLKNLYYDCISSSERYEALNTKFTKVAQTKYNYLID